jgi:hypothetical protein
MIGATLPFHIHMKRNFEIGGIQINAEDTAEILFTVSLSYDVVTGFLTFTSLFEL